MPGVCVIVAYRPKPGKADELPDLVLSRVPTLCQEGLVSDRAPTIIRARDGTIIEVSEWKSRGRPSMPRTRIPRFLSCGKNSLPCATVFR